MNEKIKNRLIELRQLLIEDVERLNKELQVLEHKIVEELVKYQIVAKNPFVLHCKIINIEPSNVSVPPKAKYQPVNYRSELKRFVGFIEKEQADEFTFNDFWKFLVVQNGIHFVNQSSASGALSFMKRCGFIIAKKTGRGRSGASYTTTNHHGHQI